MNDENQHQQKFSLDRFDRALDRIVQFGQFCPSTWDIFAKVQLFSSGTFMALLQAMKRRYQNQQLENRKHSARNRAKEEHVTSYL